MTTDNTRSADAIERDIERTQNSISDTVEQLQDRFTPKALMDSVLGDGDGGDQLVTAAKSNPLAVALIGAGALMLASGRSGSSVKAGVSSLTDRLSGNSRRIPAEPSDPHHRSYLAHMNAVDHQDGEHADDYRRRRDRARANYFMIEQGHDEDESSFRSRLDQAGDSLRDRTAAFGDYLSDSGQRLSDGASSAADAIGAGARSTASKARSSYGQNPMIGGLIAAAIGAVLGAVIPETEFEDEQLGSIGRDARSKASSLANTAKDKASELADAGKEKAEGVAHSALDKADDALDDAGTAGASPITSSTGTGSESLTTSAASDRDPATRI